MVNKCLDLWITSTLAHRGGGVASGAFPVPRVAVHDASMDFEVMPR
jgi:hypothetical protein